MIIVLKRKCGFISLSLMIEIQIYLLFEFRCIQDLKTILDGGRKLPFPDGILINGRGPNGVTFTVEQGKKND